MSLIQSYVYRTNIFLPLRTRKEIKIRPGFTPQEDVKRFRGTKQVQMDSNALPKGHIVGWTPPTANDMITIGTAQSQSAKKNAKRAAKKKKDKEEELRQKISENWDDEDEPETSVNAKAKPVKAEEKEKDDDESKTETTKDGDADKLAEQIDKLKVH
jgi:partner of Y14 and mago protein